MIHPSFYGALNELFMKGSGGPVEWKGRRFPARSSLHASIHKPASSLSFFAFSRPLAPMYEFSEALFDEESLLLVQGRPFRCQLILQILHISID